MQARLELAKQKTMDPAKMGSPEKLFNEEEGGQGLTLHAQQTVDPEDMNAALKASNRKKHNRRTAKEINR